MNYILHSYRQQRTFHPHLIFSWWTKQNMESCMLFCSRKIRMFSITTATAIHNWGMIIVWSVLHCQIFKNNVTGQVYRTHSRIQCLVRTVAVTWRSFHTLRIVILSAPAVVSEAANKKKEMILVHREYSIRTTVEIIEVAESTLHKEGVHWISLPFGV